MNCQRSWTLMLRSNLNVLKRRKATSWNTMRRNCTVGSGDDSQVKQVLVTGASGYVATSIVNDLLKKGYSVRGTVRSLNNPGKVNPLKSLSDGKPGRLELVEADLLKPESWLSAVNGCTHVLHTASPFPFEQPKNADEVIRPAVEGTLNVLKACKEAGCVKRVVMTSSVVAVGMIPISEKPLNESNWSDPEKGGVDSEPYTASKILAEKTAFDFVKNLPENERFELCTILPGYVVGPALTDQPATSMDLVKRMMVGGDLLVPDVNFTCTDIRDVVDAHVICMTSPKAPGQRYLVVDKLQAYADICKLLNDEFSSQGYSSSSRLAPRFLIRLMSFFDSTARTMNLLWGVVCKYDNAKLKEELGIQPRDCREAIIEMAYSLIDNGYIEKRANYKGRRPSS